MMPRRVYPPYERRHQPRRTEADRTKFHEENTVVLKRLDISIQKTASQRELVVFPRNALKPMYLQQFVSKYEQLRLKVQAACKCWQFCKLQKGDCRGAALKVLDTVYEAWAAQGEKDKEQQAGENVVLVMDDEDEDEDGDQAHPQQLVHGVEGGDEEVEREEQPPPQQQGQQEEDGRDVHGVHPSTPPATEKQQKHWQEVLPNKLEGVDRSLRPQAMAAQASGSSFGAWYAQQVQQQQAEEQGDVEQGLLGGFNKFIKAQGLGEAQSQVTNLATKFVASIRGEDGVVANAKQSVEATLNYSARFRAFLGLFLIGVVFYLMAFFVGLPNIVLRPAKFAISVTLGSIFTMGSFTALLGPKAHLQSLLQRDRALFSVAYVGSLFLTLYASLWAKSYILVVLSTGLQIGAFAWYALAAMPGGAAGLRMLNTVVMRGMQVGFAAMSRCFSCCITSIVKL